MRSITVKALWAMVSIWVVAAIICSCSQAGISIRVTNLSGEPLSDLSIAAGKAVSINHEQLSKGDTWLLVVKPQGECAITLGFTRDGKAATTILSGYVEKGYSGNLKVSIGNEGRVTVESKAEVN